METTKESEWRTGWPHLADPSDMVEVERRSGEREIAEVCEIDWGDHDPNDKWTCAPEDEVVRYRMLASGNVAA